MKTIPLHAGLRGKDTWGILESALLLQMGKEQEANQLPLVIVRSSLRILIRQKYFPVSSLQTVTRLQLWVVAAFSLAGGNEYIC